LSRTVFITGILGGIGRATAQTFHDAGWRVFGSDQRPHDPNDRVPIDRFLQADIADPQIGATLVAFMSELDRLDAVVNNAAMQIEKPLVQMTDAEWDLIMSTNVKAAFVVSRTAYQLLEESAGSIVNVASVHAHATSPGLAAYAASKGALVALTRASALEFAHAGIRVNAILPGAVDTPMLRAGLTRWSEPDAALAQLARRTPLNRVADGAEIGSAILFLADGDQSSFITGQALVADGGALARLSTE